MKAAIKREQSDAYISSAERKQARCKTSKNEKGAVEWFLQRFLV